MDNKKEMERAELHRAIWQIANDLRGSVDGWDFKQYVLGTLFYRYISEKLTNYLNAEAREAGDADFRKTLCVTDALQEEKGKLEEEMAVLVEMTQNIVAENARVAQDQEEYRKRYDGIVRRYDDAKTRYDAVVAAISAKEAQSERLTDFIKMLKTQDGTISEFDGSLWGGMVEFITVGRDKAITVTFRDGSEIQA